MGGNADAFALYEKATSALPVAPDFHRSLSDPALTAPLLAAASALNYALM
ncbi:hypothetical protein [Paracoccus versutus]|nr:hypothetical protein [Paracoccus versutus]